MATAKKKKTKNEPKKHYTCLICKRDMDETAFYKSRGSLVWTETDGRCLFCKECLESKFNLLHERYGERAAVMITCHYIDAPFINSLYESAIAKNTTFSMGLYMRQFNGPQWANRSYVTSLMDGELGKEAVRKDGMDLEAKWSREDLRNKRECIQLLGYDPFEDFSDKDRRLLFGDLMNYLDEDLLEDPFKLSMVIQVVISNSQIHAIDLQIAKLDPARDAADIKVLNTIKKDLVASVKSISTENEIAVKHRSVKTAGKGTLTGLMKDLRDKNFEEVEVNYYDMLKSPGTTWAMEQSNKALMSHCLFDENDRQEIFLMQREMIQKLQGELDDTKEELRLAKIENAELKDAT